MDYLRRTILILGLMLAPSTANAGPEWGVSPGVKLGWTFGRGLTYGIEISVVRLPDLQVMDSGSVLRDAIDAGVKFITQTYGAVLNIDHVHHTSTYRIRVGAEWIGPFIGVEAGPTLVFDRGTTSLGIGITPWLGFTLYPYYTYTYVIGDGKNLHDVGFYLKTPLLGFRDDEHEGLDFD